MTKKDIKLTFKKKLAFQCHLKKHSQLSKAIRKNVTGSFKQTFMAYYVLMDDLNRGSNDKIHKYDGSKARSRMVPYHEESINSVPISDVPKDLHRNDITKIFR